MRRVIAPHRLVILTSVRAAPPSARGVERKGKREPVSPPLEALADAPGDNSAIYCGGVRRRGKHFGVGKPRENEKKEERKGGVPRRDGETCTAFGNDTNASSRVRQRGCYFGAER